MNFPTKQPKGSRDTIDNYVQHTKRKRSHASEARPQPPTHPPAHTHTLWTIAVNDYLLHTKFIQFVTLELQYGMCWFVI